MSLLKRGGWVLKDCFIVMAVSCLVSLAGCGADLSDLLDNPTDATLTDLVGTWSGSLTENGVAQNYQIVVDSSGNFTASSGVSGTATISSTGAVTFSYTAGGYAVVMQGTMKSSKTQIVMSSYSWTGTSTGSTPISGTLTKGGSSSSGFLLTDVVGTWSGVLTENGQARSYQVTVNSAGNFVAGDGTSGTATISTSGTVIFTYSSGGYTRTLQGTMNSGKTQIVMSTSTWTGPDSGSASVTGTLSKS